MAQSLPFPVYFVRSQMDRWRALAEVPTSPSSPAFLGQARSGADDWTVQTYLHLKRRGHDVRLVDHFVPHAICLAHYDDVRIRDLPFNSYCVVIRADRPSVEICERRVVQTPTSVSPRDHYMPLWPQPGLIERDPARGSRMENVAYFGQEYYLPPAFKTPEFEARLASLGIRWVRSSDQDRWLDYREMDVVLAVRRAAPIWAANKPMSKLANAWLAGCPALLSAEPAYEAVRRCELDYLRVTTPHEALAALQKLKENPQQYAAMVENGRQRGTEVNAAATPARWEALLSGPIAEDFKRWRRGGACRTPERVVRFIGRAVRQKIRRRRFHATLRAQEQALAASLDVQQTQEC